MIGLAELYNDLYFLKILEQRNSINVIESHYEYLVLRSHNEDI